MKKREAKISRANTLRAADRVIPIFTRQTVERFDSRVRLETGKTKEFTDNYVIIEPADDTQSPNISHVPTKHATKQRFVATRRALEPPYRLRVLSIVRGSNEEEEVNGPRRGAEGSGGPQTETGRGKGWGKGGGRGHERDCEFVRASKKGERKNARGFTLMYRPR